jgi:hypothetical protein
MEYTLGILTTEKTNKEKCKNVSDIYKSIVGYLIARDTLNKKEKYSENTIVIEIELSLYQIFNLNTEDKINIINLGYHLTKQYLSLKNYQNNDDNEKNNETVEKEHQKKLIFEQIETPQMLWMRVAIQLHKTDFKHVKETYDALTQGYFIHATPTLFNSGTASPQLSSCFLITIDEDSIDGIYKTIKDCAKISKCAGGIGVARLLSLN